MKMKSVWFALCLMLISGLLYAEQKPIAKVVEINAAKKEIVIGGSDLGSKLFIGNIVYLNIDNEDVKLIVVFPMLTVAKCRLLDKKSSYLTKIELKSPVYKKPFSKSEDSSDERNGIADVKLLKGTWKEYWDPDGDSDVKYHDHYTIIPSGGKITVTVKSEEGEPIDQNVTDINYKKGELSLKIHTSFEVKYVLKLDKTGKWLMGSAVTPENTYLIKWEKVED